jgi:hypothetical protein
MCVLFQFVLTPFSRGSGANLAAAAARRARAPAPPAKAADAPAPVPAAPSADVTQWVVTVPAEPKEPEHAEPSDLAVWDADRLHGSFQARADGHVTSQQYTVTLRAASEVYLALRPRRALVPIDAALLVCQVLPSKELRLVAAGAVHLNSDPTLRLVLDAGNYLVIPFSTGCNLRKRRFQPSKHVVGWAFALLIVVSH